MSAAPGGTRPTSSLGALGALVVVAVLALTGSSGAQEPDPPEPAPQGPVELTLLDQTAIVTPPGRVDLRLVATGAPDDGFVELVLRGQVRTRTEFARAAEGLGLRTRVDAGTRPRLDTLPVNPSDGSIVVSLSLDPAAPGGVRLTAPGAYPLEVRIVSAGNEVLDELLTFVVVAPAADTSAPPLAVAVVAELGTPPSIQPDGAVALDDRAIDRLVALATALHGTEVPATLSIIPETVEALAALAGRSAPEPDPAPEPDGDEAPAGDDATEDDDADLDDAPGDPGDEPDHPLAGPAREALEALQTAAAERTVLVRPFVDVSVEALVAAGLDTELDQQLLWGIHAIVDHLGVSADGTTALADADLGPAGARALADRGTRRLVLHGADLDPAPTAGLSLAHRFPVPVDGPGRRTVQGMEADAELADRLGADGDPALVAQQLVAELAVIRGEQPANARGVVIRAGDRARPEVLAAALTALGRGGTLLDPVDLPGLFEVTGVLTDPAGSPVPRDLAPSDPPALGQDVVVGLPRARHLLAGYGSLVGLDDHRSTRLTTALLLVSARDLTLTERRAHLATVAEAVDAVVGAISLPARPQVTLTARSGTIPLTVDNRADHPVEVVVRLDSQRLEFPGGAERRLTLEPGTTRSDLAVRTRASGAFPLDVTILSPDGTIELTATRYTVRSTAVSGVGLVLSVGAGLFLAAWWGSHWHKTRRSRRLVPLGPERSAGEPVG